MSIYDAARLLIADDDPAIRLVLRHRLEADGHRVDEAIDSASALAALRTNRFDVALLDINLAGEMVYPAAEALAERWFALAETEQLTALSRAMAVGKGRLQAAREVMQQSPERYAAFRRTVSALRGC